LGVRISAFEYNGTVYYDDPLANYVPADNTGLTNPNIISAPGTPTIADLNISDNTIAGFTVSSTVPATGVVLYMDFNYGTSSDVTTHRLYRTTSRGNGTAYTPGATVSVTVNDLPADSYYWSVTARNNSGGSSSAASALKAWAGQNVTTYAATTKTGVTSVGATVTVASTTGIRVGDSVEVTSGTGDAGPNNTVLQILGLTTLLLSAVPLINFASAAVKFFGGGLPTGQVKDGAIDIRKLAPNTGGYLFKDAYTVYFAGAPAILPVPAGSGVRNVPITIAGTNPGASYIWPYQQGTSLTTDGYAANSTGPYEPWDAALINAWTTSGDYDWYELFYQNFASNPFTTDEYITINVSIQITSDVAGTQVQIAPLPYFTSFPSTINTQQIQTFTITDADPYVQLYTTSYWTDAGFGVDALAFAIRNITAGSTITVSSCWWTIAQYTQ
jgi:hypothetical protein